MASQVDKALPVRNASPANATPVPLMQRANQLVLTGVVILLFATQVFFADSFRSEQNNPRPSGVATGMQIDINVAEVRELSLLPSVGPVLARRIVADRTQNGPFETVGGLSRVHGIGEKTIAQIGRFCEVNPGVGHGANSDSMMTLAASEK